MKHDDREISSVGDLLAYLKQDMPNDQPTWFRGLGDSDWHLEPSLARHGGIDSEIPLIRRFKQNALAHMVTRPQTEWEWLFITQHHGLPTRLLDWTEGALIGLYFAVYDPSRNTKCKPGALWAMLPMELNADSNYESSSKLDIPGFDDDEHLNSYLPSNVQKQRVKFGPLAGIALRNTPRMQMQQGVFTVNHRDLSALDRRGGCDFLWRYIIPVDSKDHIRSELKRINVTQNKR